MDEVEIRRSARRRRTVAARREGDRVVVMVPAGLDLAAERALVDDMVAKVERRERKARRSDDDLMELAAQLSRRHLDGAARPTSVRWVGNQQRRWGSCSIDTGEIRLSDRVRGMPADVVECVLLHELAHLVVTDGHTPTFWELADRHPKAEWVKGFLAGVAHLS
ncbi:MAG: M48 family metallopeptidase [Aeromicrobium sp.]|uniref:M48 metallopeptidase family protein n=1 Tax=Aeromicrobium sp. TaxID=1871063 RepID=UPI0039E5C2C5